MPIELSTYATRLTTITLLVIMTIFAIRDIREGTRADFPGPFTEAGPMGNGEERMTG